MTEWINGVSQSGGGGDGLAIGGTITGGPHNDGSILFESPDGKLSQAPAGIFWYDNIGTGPLSAAGVLYVGGSGTPGALGLWDGTSNNYADISVDNAVLSLGGITVSADSYQGVWAGDPIPLQIGAAIYGGNEDGSVLWQDSSGNLAQDAAGNFIYDPDGYYGPNGTPTTLYIGNIFNSNIGQLALCDTAQNCWQPLYFSNSTLILPAGISLSDQLFIAPPATSVAIYVAHGVGATADIMQCYDGNGKLAARIDANGTFITSVSTAPTPSGGYAAWWVNPAVSGPQVNFTVAANNGTPFDIVIGAGTFGGYATTVSPTGTGASGNLQWCSPVCTNGYKKVLVRLNSMKGTATFYFPTTFTYTPAIVTTNSLAASLVTSISNVDVTIVTSTATSGFLVFEGM